MRLNGVLPPEATSGALRLVAHGRDSLLIEQHQGIVAYQEDRISVRIEGGCLTVSGEKLHISEYSQADLCISGRLHILEFRP